MEQPGYEDVICEFCGEGEAGYQRRKQYAQEGPWLNACEKCARVPYEPPKQFQKEAA